MSQAPKLDTTSSSVVTVWQSNHDTYLDSYGCVSVYVSLHSHLAGERLQVSCPTLSAIRKFLMTKSDLACGLAIREPRQLITLIPFEGF